MVVHRMMNYRFKIHSVKRREQLADIGFIVMAQHRAFIQFENPVTMVFMLETAVPLHIPVIGVQQKIPGINDPAGFQDAENLGNKFLLAGIVNNRRQNRNQQYRVKMFIREGDGQAAALCENSVRQCPPGKFQHVGRDVGSVQRRITLCRKFQQGAAVTAADVEDRGIMTQAAVKQFRIKFDRELFFPGDLIPVCFLIQPDLRSSHKENFFIHEWH